MNLIEQETHLPSDSSIHLIPLTKGQFAIIDAADFERLSQWKWHAMWYPASEKYYAIRNDTTTSRTIRFPMHRMILGLEEGDRRMGDHVNGNTLDNRRSNLRIANANENQWNRGRSANNTSGYKGVFRTQNGKWAAAIKAGPVRKHLGTHSTPEAAYAAYCEAAKQLHGEFARFQ